MDKPRYQCKAGIARLNSCTTSWVQDVRENRENYRDVAALLKSCAKNKDLNTGIRVHADILQKVLLRKSPLVVSSLVSMYAKCGAFAIAEEVFEGLPAHNVVLWNALITGYVQCEHSYEALDCFKRMQLEGVSPDAVTFICILQACGSVGAYDKGESIHGEIIRQGLLCENILIGGALLDMYSKCGALARAKAMFDGLPTRDAIVWNVLISGYVDRGNGKEALNSFGQMQCEGLSANAVTFFTLLKACGSIGALDKGEYIHYEIARQGLLSGNTALGNSLVDMYAKCGALAKAKKVLEELPIRNVVTWSVLIAGYAQEDCVKEALICFEQMQHEGLCPDEGVFIYILKACGSIGALEKGEILHSKIVRQTLFGNVALNGALVDMYAKCGAFVKARKVLEGLPIQDVVSWNALISAYVKGEQCDEALNCFQWMQQEGPFPDAVTFVHILRACGSKGELGIGKEIHVEIVRQGLLGANAELGNALVDLYGKCGALVEAEEVFEGLHCRDVVTWSTLIAAYARGEHGNEALHCFQRMRCEGLSPNEVTSICFLKACGSTRALNMGELMHSEIVNQGWLTQNVELGNALVDMYAKCAALAKAKEVLDLLPLRNAVSWSALITGYAQLEHGEEALTCFECMRWEGFYPDAITYACILKACGSICALPKGEIIHFDIVRQGLLNENTVLGAALVDMYAKCGALMRAKEVLEGLPSQDVDTWNALIAGYAHADCGEEALICFEQMQREGYFPDAVTFTCILKACSCMNALDRGENLHFVVDKQGLSGDLALHGALVDMYAKCGALVKARKVLQELPFWNVVLWNALMSGYVLGQHSKEALSCFEEMKCKAFLPDAVSYVCILKACGNEGALDKGEQIHVEIVKQGLLHGNTVLGNALIDMYARCGAPAKAKEVLEGLPLRDAATWSILIAGYVQRGKVNEALASFEWMQQEGFLPNEVTFVCILKACSSIGALDKGKSIHLDIVRLGLLSESVALGSALVDMYAKCGELAKAKEVLEGLPVRDVVSWNALIGGYAEGEYATEALTCFEWMQCEGLCPDEITFLCVLSACSLSGLWEEGTKHFTNMSKDYGIIPNSEHCSCMVNLYGRVGLLYKAVAVVDKVCDASESPLWFALLSACKKLGNMKLGKWAFEHAVQSDAKAAISHIDITSICIVFNIKEAADNVQDFRV